ncbi:hypothetical protein BJ912DRAFT_1056588 [Pholiota molesta]|nr:hypothetical protein BJ912DRAFT_1056588 [Pholiota molesta]
MREVFFISAASTSDSLATGDNASWQDPMTTIARLRQQNTYLLADKLQEPERFMALATTVGDKAIVAATTAMENVSKVFEAKLYEFDSERRRWEKRAKSSEKEVALLETELDEVQQERDNLKKTIPGMRFHAKSTADTDRQAAASGSDNSRD